MKSGTIELVISNKADAYALTRASAAGIKISIITKGDCAGTDDFEARLTRLLRENKIDLIILAGFMCILSEKFTSAFPNRNHQRAPVADSVFLRKRLLWSQSP